MMTRTLGLLVALAGLGCTNHNYNSALVVAKVILAPVPTPPATACVFDPSANETDFPLYAIGGGGSALVGFVIHNQLINPTTVNATLNADSTTFNPQNAFVDYEVIPTTGSSTTIARQQIPTTGSPVTNGAQASVLVPLFAPAAVQTALPAD